MKTKFLILFALVIAILASSFAFQNTQVAEINFITWQFKMPMVLLLLCTFGVGFLLAIMIAIPGNLLKKFQELKLRLKVRSLQSKVHKKDKILEQQKPPAEPPAES